MSNPQFAATHINGDPVTTYGFATTAHTTDSRYAVCWGIVDYFTRSESPTMTVSVTDPDTGEVLGTFDCVKPENGYW